MRGSGLKRVHGVPRPRSWRGMRTTLAAPQIKATEQVRSFLDAAPARDAGNTGSLHNDHPLQNGIVQRQQAPKVNTWTDAGT